MRSKLGPSYKNGNMVSLAQLKNGKAAGLDKIYPDVLEVDTEITAEMLYPLLEKIGEEEKFPEDWEEGLINKTPKKGDLLNCNNWRGVTFLSIPSKFLTRIILFKCKISHEGKVSDFIEVRNGVRQGCILSSTLFLLILNRVMKRVKGSRKR